MTVPRICITDGGGWAVRDYPDSEWPWTARPERPHAVLQPLADAAIDHGDWRELIVIDPVDIPNAHSEPSVAVAVPAYEWIEIPGTGIEIAHQLGEALAVEYRAARGEPVDEYGPREGYPYGLSEQEVHPERFQ